VGTNTRGWVIDLLIGGCVGLVVGWIVALNVMIYSGTERGYETSLAAVFDQQPIVGFAVVILVAAGPIIGVALARRMRSRRMARKASNVRDPVS
jgi:hypothetical protein